ncbi:sel1 repeat family protein [Gluconacetobacter azotocaptans]|uniref:Sel1 repeat family protein n=1 Tax=Gluconacetobacter azotocaptans TaxID=142834 RepID=A0A7W4JQ27_9PROT|nr:tetratricopeptide repeat protein [Gluconacetobacter azotocaptans]MBB2188839.1 sel1 repeat family protein [Gluconacetobacter azotocaptans]GBQ31194.1 Sel1 domain-containing protein [Gluconacetobacter azotocaptans DSM 13594]
MRGEWQGSVADGVEAICALAGAGQADAQLMLGQILLDGRFLPRDEGAALGWFLAAARHGHPMGHNMVGRCCELGWGLAPAPAEALRWYRAAACAGLDWGMYNYATGLSLGWDGPPDHVRALAWFRRAAARGHCKSFNIIGGFYEDGWAVARDLDQARAWYVRAAEGGDFRGHFNFGRFLLAEGRHAQARRHFDIARRTGTPAFRAQMERFLAESEVR